MELTGMSWINTFGAWFTGAAGYAAIGVLVVLALATTLMNKTFGISVWLIAVASLALITVSKDAVIAGQRADLATYQTNAEIERSAAKDEMAKAVKEAGDKARAGSAAAVKRQRIAESKLRVTQHELSKATEALASCRVPDDAVRLLNRAVDEARGVEPGPAAAGAGSGLPGAAPAAAGGVRPGGNGLGARLGGYLGLRAKP